MTGLQNLSADGKYFDENPSIYPNMLNSFLLDKIWLVSLFPRQLRLWPVKIQSQNEGQGDACFLLGWSNSTLNTFKAVEIFITGILTDFTNLKMQWVLGKHANWGTKSIKTVKLAPVKPLGTESCCCCFWMFCFLCVFIFAELDET